MKEKYTLTLFCLLGVAIVLAWHSISKNIPRVSKYITSDREQQIEATFSDSFCVNKAEWAEEKPLFVVARSHREICSESNRSSP